MGCSANICRQTKYIGRANGGGVGVYVESGGNIVSIRIKLLWPCMRCSIMKRKYMSAGMDGGEELYQGGSDVVCSAGLQLQVQNRRKLAQAAASGCILLTLATLAEIPEEEKTVTR